MKLLIENWRKYLNEQATATFDMGGKSWNTIESDHQKRARRGAQDAGYYFDRKLGKGQMGEVYLVENKKTGERNAMKHVVKSLYGGPKTSEREAQNYRFAMDNKSSMNQKFAKYLPDVYNVVETTKDYFIFMELLEDIPDRVKADLFALGPDDDWLSRHEKYDRLFKDPEAVYEIILQGLDGNLLLRQGDPKVYQDILQDVPNIVMKKITERGDIDWSLHRTGPAQMINHPASILSNMVSEAATPYLEQDPSYFKGLPEGLRRNLYEVYQNILQKQIIPVHGGHGTHSAAGKSGEKVERNFPEAKGLIRAMNYFLEREKWQPKDIHSGNVMVRPGTKDFVITDLGLFSLKSI